MKTKYKVNQKVTFSVGRGEVAATVVEAGVDGDATKYRLETTKTGSSVTRFERSISAA